MPDLSQHRAWHGNPIASLRRDFALLGSLRIYILDKRIRDDPEKLRHLYRVADQPKPIDPFLYDLYGSGPSTISKRPPDEEEEQPPSQSPSKKPKPDNIESTTTNDQRPTTSSNSRTWVLGPEVSTNQVIQMYSPLISPAWAMCFTIHALTGYRLATLFYSYRFFAHDIGFHGNLLWGIHTWNAWNEPWNFLPVAYLYLYIVPR